jgi:hypothetical protein
MTRFRDLFGFGRRSKTTTPKLEPRPAPPPPTPAERTKNLEQQRDEEYAQTVRSAGEAFMELVKRSPGQCYMPNDASPSLDAHRDRLRQARGEGRR